MSKAIIKKKTTRARSNKALEARADEIAIHPWLLELPTSSGLLAWLDQRRAKCNPSLKKQRQEEHEAQQLAWGGRLADYTAMGIIEPLVVVAAKIKGVKWWLVDGRDRFEGGQQLGRKQFPIRILDSKVNPVDFIISANCARKNFNGFQKAFFALAVCPHLIESGGKAGRKPKLVIADSIGNYTSYADVARRVGVSRDTVENAAVIHRICASSPTEAAAMRMRVFRGDSYQELKAADGAHRSQLGDGSKRDEPWDKASGQFTALGRSLLKDWAAIEKAGPSATATVFAGLTALVSDLPEPLKKHLKHVTANL